MGCEPYLSQRTGKNRRKKSDKRKEEEAAKEKKYRKSKYLPFPRQYDLRVEHDMNRMFFLFPSFSRK